MFFNGARLTAHECPACGCSPKVDISGRPYDCNGYPFERHPWTRPAQRPPTARTLLGHEALAPWSVWRPASAPLGETRNTTDDPQ